MSQEVKARAGAQAAVPGDQVLDVAVVMPRGSTVSGMLGAAAGVAAGGGNSTAWGVGGGMIGQRVNAASRGSFPSVVLALSASTLYVLGRDRDGLVGGWKHLHPVAHIDRSDLEVQHRRHAAVHIVELTDRRSGATLEFEARHVGGLGLKGLLAQLDA